MPRLFAAEREDLRTLALTALAVPLTWLLLLGWSWHRTVGGHDELAQNLLLIREVAESGHGWLSLLYRADLLGGFIGRDVVGPFPLYRPLSSLGLTPTEISSVSAFIVQSLLGFLGSKAAGAAARIWGRVGCGLTSLEGLGVSWLCAFPPVLAWRFGYGHLNLVAGLLPFAAGLALLTAAAAGVSTLTLAVVACFSLVLGLLHSGQQIVVYAIVFGGPILVGAWISLKGEWRRLAVPALVGASSFLVAFPALWPMIVHARSSDAPRGLGGAIVTYDVVTSSIHDWMASIPWALLRGGAQGGSSLDHETNYPAGPLLLLLLLLPWRRARALAVGLAVSLMAALAFSIDLAPFSRELLRLLPPLRSFRVPARAMLPWLFALPVFAVAALVSLDRDPEGAATGTAAVGRKTRAGAGPEPPSYWRAVIGGAAVGLLLLLAPPLLREAGAWSVAASSVFVFFRRGEGLPARGVLLALGLASVGAFSERLLPFEDGSARLAEASAMGRALRGARPELESALSRVRLGFEIPAFTVNTAFAAGLSSLDGYEVPTKRFAALLFRLRGVRYEPTAVFFHLESSERAFPALRQLYNVALEVSLPSRGSLSVKELGPTAGPAWFSSSAERMVDLDALARALLAAGDSLHERVRREILLDGSDSSAGGSLAVPVDPRCREARVLSVTAVPRAATILADVESPGACPLTFATNFTEDLLAIATLRGGGEKALAVFPSYGPLAAVLVPEGTQRVRLEASPHGLPGARAWSVLGFVLLLSAAVLQVRLELSSGRGLGPPEGPSRR